MIGMEDVIQRHGIKRALQKTKVAASKIYAASNNEGYSDYEDLSDVKRKTKAALRSNIKKAVSNQEFRDTEQLNFNNIVANSPTDWYRNEETNEIQWFEGRKRISGYESLGYYYTEIDSYNNRNFYDGDSQSHFYNGELVKSYKAEGVRKYINDGMDGISSIGEGIQTLGYAFYGTGVLFGKMIEDIKQGGDGTSLRVNMEMPIFEFNNGKLIKTDLNDFSDQEIILNGVSATSVKLPVNTGNAVTNTILSQVVEKGSTKLIENSADDTVPVNNQ